MNYYEAIIMILEKRGPATIPLIWEEMNKLMTITRDEDIDIVHLKSIIGLKREWFMLNGDLVSIRPERDPVKLIFKLSGYPGPEVKVTVDFIKGTFTFFEWHFNLKGRVPRATIKQLGSVEEFKKDLYSLHIWDWEKDYQIDGIIVDGTSWSVVLETKGEIFVREGLDSFPKEWKRFCRSMSQLTGVYLG